ncbi:uncharacterized protein E5676_scaffold403G001410 [Cucumis melo var. makuwa]|uniref:Uncharacterized protein n=1 Tax=Cucumis melo var. makuwa TaxID=1194695 RepID=A0A5A7V4Q6_CUCMM|nr:uncharacterized protein E6C27_scaffold79G00430 [Cucumis melo var. makuwa]TYK28778.1 uncharacterized protein E5676_scaffold403G001410 [Cucumis melo var. makuwa]
MFSIMINGSLDRKGVRQSDPLSLFLFVIVMEVHSRMLNRPPQDFYFHQRCEKKFGELLGLFAYLGKSSIFVVGVSNEVASRLAASMSFVLGNLSVRYLGLPLLTGRLCPNDRAPLIQRITSQIRSWTARVLSFAGGQDTEVYLWRGKDESRGGVKVAWVEVSLPFEEGGLAIRDGPSWNITSTLKSRVGWSWCLRAIFFRVLVLGIDEFGFLVVRVVSRSRVHGILFILGVVGLVGLVYYGVGGMSPSIPFVHGWPLKIGWALEIGCIGMFGLKSYRSWLPLTGLGIEGVELSWICHQGIEKGVKRKLWRVLWCGTIYFIWKEQNHRLHGGQAHDPIVLFSASLYLYSCSCCFLA